MKKAGKLDAWWGEDAIALCGCGLASVERVVTVMRDCLFSGELSARGDDFELQGPDQ